MQLPKDARDIVVDFLNFAEKHEARLTTSRKVDDKSFAFSLSEEELRYLLYDWFETRKEER